jgi:outer membrane lipoprotein-sorting protein
MPVTMTRSRIARISYHALMQRSTAAACVLLVVCGLRAVALNRTEGDRFADLFQRSLAARQSMHSIGARFTETTTTSLMEKPIVSHGTIVAAPPARVLMTYTEPARRIVLIDGRSLTAYWPDRGEREQLDISQTLKRIDQYFTHASLDQLRSMFQIAVDRDPAWPHADHIVMIPLRKQIKEGLARLDLWVNADTVMLEQLRMAFADGDSTAVHLEDVHVNVPVTNEMFRIPGAARLERPGVRR